MAVNVGQRNVKDTPQNRGLISLNKALNLSVHTIKICSNPKVFDEKYQKFIDKLVDCATNIFMSANTANNIRVTDEESKKTRLALEHKAIIYCNNLLSYINIAQRLFHLRGKKVGYWVGMTLDTRTLLGKWYKADKRRYKDF
jgi:hypothetical protein